MGCPWITLRKDEPTPDYPLKDELTPDYPSDRCHSGPSTFALAEYYVRLVDELRPLTYGLVGRKTKLMPKDVWATILGHSPDVADALIQSMILA